MKLQNFIKEIVIISIVLISQGSVGQVPYERILNASDEPQNWLTYNGGYMSQRYSLLDQINRENVNQLELKWVLQNQVFGAWQSNPIIVDGVMYVTERPNSVMAVDAVTGRVYWKYRHQNADNALVCCGANNRGVAVLNDKVYMGTLDAHLVALDRVNGQLLWEAEVGDVNLAYSVTMAPLAVKDRFWLVSEEVNLEFEAMWPHSTPKLENRRGKPTLSRAPVRPIMIVGKVMTGSTAGLLFGLPAHSILI